MDEKRRAPRLKCRHCGVTFPVPERIDASEGLRVQVRCPRKQCGEWSWFERHELGLGREETGHR